MLDHYQKCDIRFFPQCPFPISNELFLRISERFLVQSPALPRGELMEENAVLESINLLEKVKTDADGRLVFFKNKSISFTKKDIALLLIAQIGYVPTVFFRNLQSAYPVSFSKCPKQLVDSCKRDGLLDEYVFPCRASERSFLPYRKYYTLSLQGEEYVSSLFSSLEEAGYQPVVRNKNGCNLRAHHDYYAAVSTFHLLASAMYDPSQFFECGVSFEKKISDGRLNNFDQKGHVRPDVTLSLLPNLSPGMDRKSFLSQYDGKEATLFIEQDMGKDSEERLVNKVRKYLSLPTFGEDKAFSFSNTYLLFSYMSTTNTANVVRDELKEATLIKDEGELLLALVEHGFFDNFNGGGWSGITKLEFLLLLMKAYNLPTTNEVHSFVKEHARSMFSLGVKRSEWRELLVFVENLVAYLGEDIDTDRMSSICRSSIFSDMKAQKRSRFVFRKMLVRKDVFTNLLYEDDSYSQGKNIFKEAFLRGFRLFWYPSLLVSNIFWNGLLYQEAALISLAEMVSLTSIEWMLSDIKLLTNVAMGSVLCPNVFSYQLPFREQFVMFEDCADIGACVRGVSFLREGDNRSLLLVVDFYEEAQCASFYMNTYSSSCDLFSPNGRVVFMYRKDVIEGNFTTDALFTVPSEEEFSF